MKEAVSDVIALRAGVPEGWNRLITGSVAVHVIVLATLILIPRGWWPAQKPPRKIMEISLGGAVGQQQIAPTNIGGRPVEQVAPEPKRPEPIKPAAAKPDVMTVPVKAPPKPVKPPPPPPKAAEKPRPPSPVTQPPTTGRQVTPGNSRAETGVVGIGTGLSIGGGGLGGTTTLSDFCCPQYLTGIVERIRNNWDSHQTERGSVIMEFTVQRNGQITGLSVAQPGTFLLNRASQVAFTNLQLPPLPPEYKPSSITLRLTFEYK